MYLQANNVEKFYGNKEARVQVLKGISCGIEQGEICVLLGPSGSGKSTFLNLIGGIERIDKGELLIGGKDLAGMPDKELALYRRHTLGFVFQSYHLVSNLTVKENMESGAYLGRHPKSIEDLLGRLRTSCPEVSSNAVPSVGHWRKIRSFFYVMSRRVLWIIIPPETYCDCWRKSTAIFKQP